MQPRELETSNYKEHSRQDALLFYPHSIFDLVRICILVLRMQPTGFVLVMR